MSKLSRLEAKATFRKRVVKTELHPKGTSGYLRSSKPYLFPVTSLLTPSPHVFLQFQKGTHESSLLTCSHVMLSNEHKRHFLDAPWTGLWNVLRRGPKTSLSIGKARLTQYALTVCSRLTCWLTSRNSPSAAPRPCPLVMFPVLHAAIVVLLLHRASVANRLR